MAASGAHKCPKSDKLDEAQALAKSCAGRPDFLPCDGLSICATHSHGKCFKLHWCCHLGWCHCKYVYQPMTNVCQLPSTTVPPVGSEYSNTIDLSVSLAERFLKLAPCFQSPPHLESPKYCVIADLFVDDYIVKRINGKMCYVQRPPPPLPEPPHPPTPSPPAPATPQMPKNLPRQPVKPMLPAQHIGHGFAKEWYRQAEEVKVLRHGLQCKYVYQPMTNVCQLPSTTVPPVGSEYSNTIDLSVSLAERFLKLAPCFQSPPHLESPKYCVIADLFVDDYIVKRINGKMCYVQRPPPPLPEPPHPPTPSPPAPATPQMPKNLPRQPVKPMLPAQHTPAPVQQAQQVHSEHKHPSPVDKIKGPKMDHCSSPSSSEDSGINALGLHYLESCEEESEEEEDELSTDGNSSPSSLWDQDDCSVLSPSKSMIEIIEKIETTV